MSLLVCDQILFFWKVILISLLKQRVHKRDWHTPLVFSCLCCPSWRGNKPPVCPGRRRRPVVVKLMWNTCPWHVNTPLHTVSAILPAGIRTLEGSSSYRPSSPPWPPSHTAPQNNMRWSRSDFWQQKTTRKCSIITGVIRCATILTDIDDKKPKWQFRKSKRSQAKISTDCVEWVCFSGSPFKQQVVENSWRPQWSTE